MTQIVQCTKENWHECFELMKTLLNDAHARWITSINVLIIISNDKTYTIDYGKYIIHDGSNFIGISEPKE